MIENKRLLDLIKVSRYYRKGKQQIKVLDQLDLQVNASEFVALMGPSGSGKTTLLNLIGGIDKPTSGQILASGQDITKLSSVKLGKWRAKNVGFIFQSYYLMPHLNALQNVELPLLLTKFSAKQRRQRAMAALEVVGLKQRVKHRPSELSGGQEQRVAIARAIVGDPMLLLADEPTGDLDATTTGEILSLLKSLNEDYKKTILMVTHDHTAADYADRTISLSKGRVGQDTHG